MRDELMRALDFDSDDLATNRAGMMSAPQVERLKLARRRAVLVTAAALVVIALVAAGLLFLAQRGGSWVGLVVGVALTLINAVIMARAAQNWLRTEDDLRRGEVETLEGVIQRTVRVFGRLPVYIVKIGSQEVVVTRDVFNTLADGARYRLYRARRTGTVLTAERV